VVPIVEPVSPALDPVVRAIQPATPILEPVFPIAEPVIPVVESTQPIVEPVLQPVRPIVSILEPTTQLLPPVHAILEPVIPVTEPGSPVVVPPAPSLNPVSPPVVQPAAPVLLPPRPSVEPLLPVVDPVATRVESIMSIFDTPIAAPVQQVSANPQAVAVAATAAFTSAPRGASFSDQTALAITGDTSRLERLVGAGPVRPAPSVAGIAQAAVGGVWAPHLGRQASSAVGPPGPSSPTGPTQTHGGSSLAAVLSALSDDSLSGQQEHYALLVHLPSSITQTVPVPPG
jgi:hypothetical protein